MKKYLLIFTLIIGLTVLLSGCGKMEKRYKLYSLSNSTQTNGSFFLGCGDINENPVFYFYYETENGYKKLDYSPIYFSKIYEDLEEGEQPYLILTAYDPFNGLICSIESNRNTIREFHIPPNSITNTFNLDVSKIK